MMMMMMLRIVYFSYLGTKVSSNQLISQTDSHLNCTLEHLSSIDILGLISLCHTDIVGCLAASLSCTYWMPAALIALGCNKQKYL